MRRPLHILLLALLFLCAPTAPAEAAQRLGLSNMVVDNHAGRVKVRFGVTVKPMEEVRKALEEGDVLALSCRARLFRIRDYAWNTLSGEAELVSPLVALGGGAFEISLPGAARERFRGRDLELVMKEAWGGMSMDLGSWAELEKGKSYSLVLEIRMVRQDVPGWLKGALFFWNFDAVSPATYRLDFTY